MKENLAKSREEAKHASEEVKYKHGVGLEDAAVDPSRHSVRKDVEIRTQGIGGLKILKSVKKGFLEIKTTWYSHVCRPWP